METLEGLQRVVNAANLGLSLAVIAHTPRFQDGRRSDLRYGGARISSAFDIHKRCRLQAERIDETLFEQAVLRDAECLGAREDRARPGDVFHAWNRDV